MKADLHSVIRTARKVDIVIQAINECDEIDTRDVLGQTPLMVAAVYGHFEIAELLIRRGADVNAKSNSGSTPLLLAATGFGKAHDQIMIALLEAGADVNAVDNNGMTVLMWAAWLNRLQAVKTLLEHNADINVKCNNGMSALDYAEGKVVPAALTDKYNQLEQRGKLTKRTRQILEDKVNDVSRADLIQLITKKSI